MTVIESILHSEDCLKNVTVVETEKTGIRIARYKNSVMKIIQYWF